MNALASAARDLALEGFAVFPCTGNKTPCIKNGCLAATSDPDPAYEMFCRSPAAQLIGVATGEISGVVVLDFDPPHGVRWFRDHLGKFPETRLHQTRRHGIHAVYQCPEKEIRNSASKIAPNVDVRGWHGYVIWPPSSGYSIIHEVDPAPFPDWLLKKLTRKPKVNQAKPEKATDGNVQNLARFVARLGPGTRNTGLFWAAARAGEKVAAGAIGRETAYANLAYAVQGWEDPVKTLGTLENGLRVGQS